MAEEQKPYAIAKLVRGKDGTPQTVYIDAKTGKQLTNLNGYEILNNQNYLDPNTLKSELGEPKETEVTENPLETRRKEEGEKEFTSSTRKNSGGDTKDSRNDDRTGFNTHGPDGKDITDTKLGRIGVGMMGGMGGKVIGAGLGLAVGGPIGAAIGGLAGGIIGKKAVTGTSPYAKKQAEAKKKEAKEKPNKQGIISKALGIDDSKDNKDGLVSKAKSFVDSIFDGTVSEQTLTQDMDALPDNAPTPGVRPSDPVGLVSRPDNPTNPLGIGGVNYSHPDRGPWQQGLAQETVDVANRLTGTLDNPAISSAYRSPAINAAVGGAPKSAHVRGLAFDMPTSQMTDDEKQKAVEMGRLAGAKRIGTYPDESLHFDMLEGYDSKNVKNGIPTVDDTYGMYARTGVNAVNRAPGWFTAGMTQDRFAPTPTERPNTKDPDRVKDDFDLSPFAEQENIAATSAFDNIGPRSQQALADSKQQREDRFAGVSLKDASPAAFAGLGLTTRSPSQISAMAQAIAGELSPSSLAALAANDPQAQQELAGIVASMENRAASKKFGTLENTLTPSQYNSLMSGNLKTTQANYNKYGQVIEKNIGDFLSGTLKPADPNATSYFNPDIASPAWGSKMNNPMNIGEHKFGVLDGPYDYGPSSTFKAERERMAKAQVSDTRGFTPSKDYSGPGLSGKTDSPSEGGSRFGGSGLGSPSTGSKGYSGNSGKADSPSESGGRFGGSGLGSGIGKGSGGSSYGNSGTGSGGLSGGKGGSVSGENAGKSSSSKSSSSKSSSGGLGKNSDGSDNGWGGRSGSV